VIADWVGDYKANARIPRSAICPLRPMPPTLPQRAIG